MNEITAFVEMCSLNKDKVKLLMVCKPGAAHSQRDQIETPVIVQVYLIYIFFEISYHCSKTGISVLGYVS